MGFECGIVGLPNVGKSTIFNALTSAGAPASNFPFCTIDPNKGVVQVPDHRLADIARHIPTKQLVPTTMTFVDIAGLVRGASKGEGLGNQFLAHIREVKAIAHVVRCFQDPDIIHVDGAVDPLRDIEVIDTELMLADLERVTQRQSQYERRARGQDKEAQKMLRVLEAARLALEAGKPARTVRVEEEDRALLDELQLITSKRVLYVANVGEQEIGKEAANPLFQKVLEHATREGSVAVAICGKIEAELSELAGEERGAFLHELGITEPGLDRVVRAGYSLLHLLTFFTAGPKQVAAWTVRDGAQAPEAAGVIHSDFERGFIRAEVYHFDDLMQHKSESAIKQAGAWRLEGKSYVVRDGDILFFRFSV